MSDEPNEQINELNEKINELDGEIDPLKSQVDTHSKLLPLVNRLTWLALGLMLLLIILDFAVVACLLFFTDLERSDYTALITCIICIHILAISGISASAFVLNQNNQDDF